MNDRSRRQGGQGGRPGGARSGSGGSGAGGRQRRGQGRGQGDGASTGRTGGVPKRTGGPRSGGAGRGQSAQPRGGSRGQSTQPGGVPRRAPAVPARQLPPSPQQPYVDVHDPDGVRLQKLLAAAGVGSRRACEALIAAGRVSVDGQIVRELGVRIDPIRQAVHVDGVRVQLDENRVYLAFNKPLGVVSTMSDDLGRPCIGDYVAQRSERLFHVGRLDADTDGLMLLTNDGELAHRLQHPSYGVLKTYVATVPGPVARDVGRTLRAGVRIDDRTVAVDHFTLIDSTPGKALIEVSLHEGSKHVVRRLLDAVGHPVQTLTRTTVGPIRLGQLGSGKVRPLNSQEIGQLYTAAGL